MKMKSLLSRSVKDPTGHSFPLFVLCQCVKCMVSSVLSGILENIGLRNTQVRDHITNAKVVINVSVIIDMLNYIRSPGSTKDNLSQSNS